MRGFSLRTRLVAVAVALVAFGVAATGVATYFTLRNYLSGQLDREVDRTADRALALLGPRLGKTGEHIENFEVAVVLPDGTAYPVPGPTDPGLLLTPGQAAVILHSDGPVTLVAGDKEELRVTSRSLPANSQATLIQPTGQRTDVVLGPGAQLAIGLPTQSLHSTLGKLVALEVIGGAIVVAGAGALSALGVRLGLRPLDRVTRTARTVAAELSPDGTGLDRRVAEADPGTEVGQLAEAVNTMLDAVEREYSARWESEQRMRRFLADASHELRTPLTSLRGYAELIRLRGGDGFGAEARDSLGRIESEGTRMSRLVDDLLTLARSDRGMPVERAPVDVAELVADAAADLRATHPEREVSVEAAGPLVVLGDRDQLVQVVTNVLSNAAAHATSGGPIRVSAARGDGEVRVAVADTGPGMRPEQVTHAFDRFWRADAARTRARGGSGLGLSIVHALVTDHGGRVTLDSSVRAGTTVTLHLPAATEPPDGARS